MGLSVLTIVLSLCAVFATAAPEYICRPPPPDFPSVHLAGITYAGSGCPAGSVAFSGNPASVSLAFNKYTASISHKIPATKGCTIYIKFIYPPIWQFSVYKVNYKGQLALGAGVTAALQYHLTPGSRGDGGSEWNNPATNFDVTEPLLAQHISASPCGDSTILNVTTNIDLRGGERGTMNIEDFGLIICWTKCG